MATTIRPELSEKNPYWIEKHRYYELKHFCLQYPIWRKAYKFLTEGSLQNTTGSKANRMKLASTKKGIENFLTGSLLEIRPMRIDKLQGLQLKVATVDEWLSGDIREDVIGAIEQGASKVNDYLIVAISSEGTVRNGAGDTIKMELMDILKGDYVNPHVSIWWYKLDSIDEVADPDKWLKANPNLGKTVSYETYQLDVERAEKAPAARNDILAKRFGLPMEGYTYYFTYEETLPHRHRDYWQMPCSLGADLSQGDDFCAFTFLFPLSNGSFGVKTRNYISSLTLMKLPAAMRIKYDQFMKEGSADMAKSAKTGLGNAIAKVKDMIDNGVDTQPMIRPILDLSDIEEKSHRLNTLFSRSQALTVSTGIAASRERNLQNEDTNPNTGNSYKFVQNNYSPKALSRTEIYRQTKNQFSAMERMVET